MKEISLPLILDIKGNSLDDGPGIRSVVFFKGCPLSCVWCHNPESKKTTVELAFDAARCVDCGACREICPEAGVLSKENPFYIDRARCTLCFACVEVCPSGALEQVGTPMTVEEIVEKILPDKPFFDTSKGGVTLSGGEPTLHMEFASALAAALKKHSINILLETCGQFDPDRFMNTLYPHVDAIYFDIKILDPQKHKKYCGISNEKIIANFKHLCNTAQQDGKLLLPRTPLIPGITDTDENINGIAGFLKDLGITEAALLPYNPLWHEKTQKIGVHDPLADDKKMTGFPERDILERCKAVFAKAGIGMAK